MLRFGRKYLYKNTCLNETEAITTPRCGQEVFVVDVREDSARSSGRVQSRERKKYTRYGQQTEPGHLRRETGGERGERERKRSQENKDQERRRVERRTKGAHG